MSEETKTYVFGQDSNIATMLAPYLSQRGIDPSVLAMMNNNGFGGNNSAIWILFLLFCFGGWGGNGWGGNGNLANQLNNDAGRDMLLQAINGNGSRIGDLAATLNSDINTVTQGIYQVQSAIQNVGSTVGMSTQQVINSIQLGNSAITSQLFENACSLKTLITDLGYQNRLANLEQTNILGAKIDEQTRVINDRFCELEKREMQDKIAALSLQNQTLESSISNAQQTAQIQSYVAGVVAPIASDVAALKAASPATVTIPYPQLTAVPTYAYGNGYGFYNTNGGSLWS